MRERASGAGPASRITVRVQPGARRNGFVGWHGDLPKLKVTAPSVGGAANTAVVAAVAEALGVRPRDVRLVGGRSSRTKVLEVQGLDGDALADRLRSAVGRGS
jgi:hypothetical protein